MEKEESNQLYEDCVDTNLPALKQLKSVQGLYRYLQRCVDSKLALTSYDQDTAFHTELSYVGMRAGYVMYWIGMCEYILYSKHNSDKTTEDFTNPARAILSASETLSLERLYDIASNAESLLESFLSRHRVALHETKAGVMAVGSVLDHSEILTEELATILKNYPTR